jgi:glycerol-1-phosphate dehydrogenase [NAD(P)+]
MNLKELKKYIKLNELCECGQVHELFTKEIVIEKNVTPKLLKFIRENFGEDSDGWVICDHNTYKAADDMIGEMELSGIAELDINSHHADEFMLEDCERILNSEKFEFDYFIACGAGTIHDITRVMAHKYNKPFISYPTAASVDGFVSGIAPITTKNGMKITLKAASPIALFADIDVLAAAPARLTVSGTGDILGKYIALADWRISNLLTGEYICNPTVEYEYAVLHSITKSITDLYRGRSAGASAIADFCAELLEALVITGLCMQYTGNSRPASAAEHHIAHFFEMGIILSNDSLHGENVGVGSFMCADLYHEFAGSKNIRFVENYDIDEDMIRRYFGDISDEIIRENAPNSVSKVTPGIFYSNLKKIKEIISWIPTKQEFIEFLDGMSNYLEEYPNEIKFDNLKCDMSEVEPLSFKLAPYIRDRLTLLKLMRCIEFD